MVRVLTGEVAAEATQKAWEARMQAFSREACE